MKIIERKKHNIDLAGQSLGRMATNIASLLMGKNKASFVKNEDRGDSVVVKNADKMKMSIKKLKQKNYYSYSGYPGGMKKKNSLDIFEKDPTELVRKTVFQMLPDNKLRKNRMKRLVIE